MRTDRIWLGRLAGRPAIFPRLAFEMGVYLAYAQDERIAGLWGKWLADHPDLLARPRMAELLAKAAARNKILAGVGARR